MQSSAELGNTFSRAWELLTRNWIIIVPGLVIGIVAALIVFMLGAVGVVSAVGANAVGMAGAGLAAAFVSAMIIGA
ncbi:MAG TPA: hypothetical protein VFA29_09710, partial [Candidatus Baltobacteraceae bacterium]|nr:hypothetical protein [Candidatus Baltobacteraceae bacterium]